MQINEKALNSPLLVSEISYTSRTHTNSLVWIFLYQQRYRRKFKEKMINRERVDLMEINGYNADSIIVFE